MRTYTVRRTKKSPPVRIRVGDESQHFAKTKDEWKGVPYNVAQFAAKHPLACFEIEPEAAGGESKSAPPEKPVEPDAGAGDKPE